MTTRWIEARAYAGGGSASPPYIFSAIAKVRASSFWYESRIEAVFEAGVRKGEFRDLEPWLAARAWFGMHNYTYLWIRPGGRLSARDAAKPFAEIFMHGMEVSGRDAGAE